MSFDLTTYLVSELFCYLLIMCRVGSVVMLIPGIGDGFVSPRIRLLFTLMLCLVLLPVLKPFMPPVPESPALLFRIIAGEIIFGIFIGSIIRLIFSVMHTAGMIIATQSSLASAMLFDPSQGAQGTQIGNFLTLIALTLFFATDLHHKMLLTVADSYTLFSPAAYIPVEDMAKYYSSMINECFKLAIRLSSPIIIITLVLYFSAGILGKLMPALQIFFLIIPIQILISFFILVSLISSMMLVYMEYTDNNLSNFLESKQ